MRMPKTWPVLVALTLCWGCHPRHKPKKPKPKPLEVTNTCDEAVNLAIGVDPDADETTRVEIDAGETLVWTLADREQVWSRDDDQAEWVAASHTDDGVVSVCITATALRAAD